MTTFSTDSLRKFISSNNLGRGSGIILFNAVVNLRQQQPEYSIHSQVQILLLPNEIALYILEFLKESFHMNEMYSSGNYHFKCPEPKLLEIYENAAGTTPLLSIIPL